MSAPLQKAVWRSRPDWCRAGFADVRGTAEACPIDPTYRARSCRARFASVLEPAAGVRIASGVAQPLGLGNRAVGLVAVGLQDAGEAVQQAHGYGAAAGRVVVEEDDPAIRRPGCSDPDPVFGGGRFIAAQHLHPSLIALDQRGLEQLPVHQIDDRHHALPELDHPACHRRTRQIDAEARENVRVGESAEVISTARLDHH